MNEFSKIKKPLGRSITIGCVIFMSLMCLFLVLADHISLRHSLYQRYEVYITDILKYVTTHIDNDDLEKCVNSVERSKAFDELELFMDGIKEDFDIHYLYILKPIRPDKIMSVISAQNHYDRYENTEGNLYLGWISDDEYDEPTIDKLFEVMNDSKICFFEETTEWGTDYTGAISIRNSEGKPYAVLAVDVDISNIKKLILKRTLLDFFIILLLGTIYIIIFLIWAQKNITKPITLLEKSVVAFAKRSHGQRNTEALQFTAPEINTENEVQSLSSAVTQMTKDMRDYVDGLVNAEKKAAFMSELAKKDALTGIRNKSAYDLEVMHLSASIAGGKEIQFGIAMVDLNYLKKINDTYGHEKGNVAIIKLCNLVCTIFCHSPVFRIGAMNLL